MVARSKKDIEKAHALNKRVRKEKARLRKRKHRRQKMVTVCLRLHPDVKQRIESVAKERGISPQRVVREALKKAMRETKLSGVLGDGISKELNIEVDKSTE